MRVVLTVFKVLLVTIVSMILIDTTITMISIINLNNQIDATSRMVQQNIMEDNYLSPEATAVYNAILNGGEPELAEYNGEAYRGITHEDENGQRVTGAEGLTSKGIRSTEITMKVLDKDGNEVTEPQPYGEFVTLNIRVSVEPSIFMFTGRYTSEKLDNARHWYTINMDKNYAVPCLRYTK